MKKIFLIISLLFVAAISFAQQTSVVAKRMEARDSIKISDRWVNDVDDDTTLLNGQTRELLTANAIYDFVNGRHNALHQALLDTAEALRDDLAAGVANGDKTDITVSGAGLIWTVDNDAVTYAKMQNVSATNRLMGRITSGAGDMEELTPTQVTAMLNVFTSSFNGLAPASGGGTTNFLRADGTWAEPEGGGGGGEANIGSNLGGGLSNYDSKTGVTLQFNTFYSSDFDLASNLFKIDYANGQEVSHSVDGFATATQATRWDSVTYFRNTGPTGEGILIEISAGLLGFKKLIAGDDIDFDVADSSITINATGGGGRFGLTGEDDAAGENRSFDLGSYVFAITGDDGGITFSQNDGVDASSFVTIHGDGRTTISATNFGGLNANMEVAGGGITMEADFLMTLTTGIITFSANSYVFDTSITPSSAGDAGSTGQFAWDASYIYICIAPSTWKRVAIATW